MLEQYKVSWCIYQSMREVVLEERLFMFAKPPPLVMTLGVATYASGVWVTGHFAWVEGEGSECYAPLNPSDRLRLYLSPMRRMR